MKRVSVKAVAVVGGLALALLVGCSSQASSPSSGPSGENAVVPASSSNFTISDSGTTTGLDPTDPTGTNGGGKILGGSIAGSTGTVKIKLSLGDPFTYDLTNVTFSGSPNAENSTLTATWTKKDLGSFTETLYYAGGQGYSNPNPVSFNSNTVTVKGLQLVPAGPAFTISAAGTATGIDPSQSSDPKGGNILGGSIAGSTGTITISGPAGTPMEFALTGVTVSGSPNSQGSTLASTWTYNSGKDISPASGTLSYNSAGSGYSGTLTGGSSNFDVKGLVLVPVG